MTEEEREDRLRKRAALLLLPILLLGAGCCFWSLFAGVAAGEAVSFIAAPLGSQALANYGEDEIPGRLRSLSISIVEAVIRDRDPEGEDADARATEVIESLKSPVPTVTPKPGDPTATPTSMPTTTPTSDLVATGTATETGVPSPSPIPSRTPTPTKTNVPTAEPTSTSGPSSTPGPCKVPPHIEIKSPLPDQHFTMAEELPGQAFAFDPDNVDPVNCSKATAIFPDDDGEGISGDPEVHMKIEWHDGSGWVLVHTEMEDSAAYCPFGDDDPDCLTHDLSTGEWPDSTPINTGKHRLKAKVLQDDEGVSSGWVWVEFWIDPVPTATSPPPPTATDTPPPPPTATDTPPPPPTATDTPPPPPTATPDTCALTTLAWVTPSGPHIIWNITNGNPSDVIEITQFVLAWGFPESLEKAEMDGADFWNGSLSSPATVNSGWSGSVDKRRVDPADTRQLRYHFDLDPVPATGYALDLTLKNLTTSDTCVLSVTVP